jgi:hypothetical protein
MGLFSRKVVISPERRRELIDEMSVESARFFGREMVESAYGISKGGIDRANFIAQFAPKPEDGDKYYAFEEGKRAAKTEHSAFGIQH